ncbi:hypothetical protein ACEZDB_33085 [Streptacidiphilus sp. N1-3]|uniref:Uncharacterized protein n=1 Tax=Streptacidiphilus alkalitolerans TaxID=3342712 RepID=A0ABV6XBV6_9ACTN
MIDTMNTLPWTAEHATGGPLDQVFRIVRDQVPDLVIEHNAAVEEEDGDWDEFFIRMATNPDPLRLECRSGGQPPFTVFDEYSSIDARDPAAAAEAVLEFLSA